ncbi:MAG: hypothetical protein AB1405_13840, partial [Bdellovibrionota bacterium]
RTSPQRLISNWKELPPQKIHDGEGRGFTSLKLRYVFRQLSCKMVIDANAGPLERWFAKRYQIRAGQFYIHAAKSLMLFLQTILPLSRRISQFAVDQNLTRSFPNSNPSEPYG